MKLKLTSEAQAKFMMQKLWPKMVDAFNSGKTLEMEITAEKRSGDQNEMIHAIIGQIAKQATHIGSRWSAEDFKRLLVAQFAKETGRYNQERIVPSLDGSSIVQLGLQTRKFTKEDASEFTEWLMAWCAENGVELDEVH